ncbi:MAG: hypothetical protein Q4F00_07880 [bacterium]|nr:hypothetical protein [bacterium]
MIRNLLWTICVDEGSFNGRVKKAIGYESLTEDLRGYDQSLNELYGRYETLNERFDASGAAQVSAQNDAVLSRLERRLRALEDNIQYLQRQQNASPAGQLAAVQEQISGLSRELEALKRGLAGAHENNAAGSLQYQVNHLSSVLNSQINENLALKQTVEKQQNDLAEQDRRLRGQEELLRELERQNREQSRAFEELKRQITQLLGDSGRVVPQQDAHSQPQPASPSPFKPAQKTAAPSLPPSAPLSPPVQKTEPAAAAWPARSPSVPLSAKPWITFFALPQPQPPRAVFQGDWRAVRDRFAQSIRGMEGLADGLAQLPIAEPAKNSFAKNIRFCREALEKFYSRFDFEGCDEDELSEKVTEKFFKIISDNLLDSVMIAIYRGGQAAGYERLLQNVNNYLSGHGIYTLEILPGMSAQGSVLPHIEPPIYKKTAVPSQDGLIDEVSLLPYFMAYEEDGNLEILRKRGRVVCLKYGA